VILSTSLLWGVATLLKIRTPFPKIFGLMGPAFCLTVIVVLLVDNFLYTVFGWGLVKTHRMTHWVSSGIFIGVIIWSFYTLLKVFRYFEGLYENKLSFRIQNMALIGFFALSVISLVIGDPSTKSYNMTKTLADAAINESGDNKNESEDNKKRNRKKNILIFGSDGVNARFTSLYGFSKDTTPHLKKFFDSRYSILALNSFANSEKSSGSVTSTLTSKMPFQTGVFHIPNTLLGTDANEHIAALLRTEGYRTAHVGSFVYTDPYRLGLLNGYDYSNFRASLGEILSSVSRASLSSASTQFLGVVGDRINQRILHLLGIRKMRDYYALVTERFANARVTDRRRVNWLNDFIVADKEKPFFAHLHLMGSHGPGFLDLPKRKFSQDPENGELEEWKHERYLDAIYNMDIYFGQVIETLKRSGQLKDTIIVFTSDHGYQKDLRERVPFVIYDPDLKKNYIVSQNVQNLDLLPTLLELIGYESPAWVKGKSVLASNYDGSRPIYSAAVYSILTNKWKKSLIEKRKQSKGLPLQAINFAKGIYLIICDSWFYQNFKYPDKLKAGRAPEYQGNCESEYKGLSETEIKSMISRELLGYGLTTKKD